MAKHATSAIITCALDRRDPHADDVPGAADHAGTDRRGGPRRAGRRRDRASARARPAGRTPRAGPGLFKEVLAIVKDRSDVVINLTTGGSPHMTVDERSPPPCNWPPSSRR